MSDIAHSMAALAKMGAPDDTVPGLLAAMAGLGTGRASTSGLKNSEISKANHKGNHKSSKKGGGLLHECFDCIMQVPYRLKKKQYLTSYFKKSEFLRGVGDYQSWQLLTFSKISSILYHPELYGNILQDFDSLLAFKIFLVECGICKTVATLMALEKPAVDESERDPQWECTAFYCVCVAGSLANLEKDFIESKINKSNELKVREIAGKLVDTGMIATLLQLAGGLRGVVEVIKACWTIRELSFSSPLAAYEVMKYGGVPLLGRLFSPGHFERELASVRDKGFDEHSKMLLAQGVDDMLPQADPFDMTDEEAYRRALVRCTAMQENAGAAIAYTLLHCKEARRCLLNEECGSALKATLRWLQQPAVTGTDQGNTLSAVMVIRQVINTNASTVTELITKHRMLSILEPWLCASDHWPVDDILHCLLAIVKYGGSIRCAVIDSQTVVPYLGYLIFCPINAVQETALHLIVLLASEHQEVITRLLEKDIISPRLLARVPRSNSAVFRLINRLEKICAKVSTSWRKKDHDLETKGLGVRVDFFKTMKREQLREAGKMAFQGNNFEEASRLYLAATMVASDLSPCVDQLDAMLLSNLAECYLRLNAYEDAIHAASMGLMYSFNPSENCVAIKAAFRRSKALLATQRYFESMSDAAYCCRHNPQEAKFSELRDKAAQLLEASRRTEGHKGSAHLRHRKCTGCGLEGPGMKKCSRCETAFFCSRSCLKEAWPEHQKSCNKEDTAA